MLRSTVLLLSLTCTLLAGPSEDREDLRRLAQAGRWNEVLQLTDGLPLPAADVLYYRGLAEARLGRSESARSTLETGRERFPDDYRFPLELGGLAFTVRDLDRARRLVERALHLNPGDPYALDLLGTTCYLSGDLPSTLEFWNRIDKPKISGVRLESGTRLDPLLRNRLIPIVPGETLRLQELRDTLAELTTLHLYTGLNVRLDPDRDSRFTVIVSALERRGLLGGRKSALFSAARGLPYQTIHADLFNLDRAAMNLNSLFRWDARKERLLSRLERPFALHPQWRWSLGTDLRDEDWKLRGNGPDRNGQFPVYGLEHRSIGFQLDWIPGARWHWSGGPRLVWRKFDFGSHEPTPGALHWNGWSLEYSTSLERTLVYLPKHRLELRALGRLTGRGTLAGRRTRMIRFEGGADLSAYLDPGELDWRVGLAYRGGVIGGSPALDALFFIGFDRDDPTGLRGHIATFDGFKGNAPFGTRKHLVRSEIEKRLWSNGLLDIELAPFLDFGRAWGAPRTPRSQGWLADAGVELRVRTPLGLGLSVDWGWNLVEGGSSWYASPLDPLLPGQERY